MSKVSSVILLRIPLMLICNILRSLGLVAGKLEVEQLEEGDWVGEGGGSLSVVERSFVGSELLEVRLVLSGSVDVDESEVVELSLESWSGSVWKEQVKVWL